MTIAGDQIAGTYHRQVQAAFQTYSPGDPTLVKRLEEKSVTINGCAESRRFNRFSAIWFSWLPMFLILGVWIFFMRQMQAAQARPWASASRRPSC